MTAIVLSILIYVLALVALFTPRGLGVHLTDADLAEYYRFHHDVFDRLRNLALSGALPPILMTGDAPPSMERQIRSEFDGLVARVAYVLELTTDGDNVRFIVDGSSSFAFAPESIRGIEYLRGDPQKQGQLVQRLDDVHTLPPGVYFRQIEPHWYIFYQYVE